MSQSRFYGHFGASDLHTNGDIAIPMEFAIASVTVRACAKSLHARVRACSFSWGGGLGVGGMGYLMGEFVFGSSAVVCWDACSGLV